MIGGERAVNFIEGAGLDGEEGEGGCGALGFGFGDGATVLVEDRERGGAELPWL